MKKKYNPYIVFLLDFDYKQDFDYEKFTAYLQETQISSNLNTEKILINLGVGLYAEKMGSGIYRINQALQKQNLQKAIFDFDENRFITKIYAQNFNKIGLTQKQNNVLQLIKNNS